MNLNDRDYAEFKVSDLFNVKYGVNLELNACVECDKSEIDSVNFVARTAENNGVSSRVMTIDDVEPQKAGLISVAGGGSVLSTFLQNEPFYSGRDLYTLDSKDNISDEAKMFVITIIEKNKYKYSYGRQANKTLPDLLLKLPINDAGEPDYQFMEDYIKSLHHQPLTTKNKSGQAPDLNVQDWGEFKIKDLFKVELAKGDIKFEEVDKGDIPLVSSGESNNGVVGYINKNGDGKSEIFPANRITIDMFGNAFYQNEPFYAVSHGRVNILNPKFDLTRNIGLFISAIIKQEQYKFSYGRAVYSGVAENMDIVLPVDANNNPNWQFMEDYMNVLPYGDRLEG